MLLLRRRRRRRSNKTGKLYGGIFFLIVGWLVIKMLLNFADSSRPAVAAGAPLAGQYYSAWRPDWKKVLLVTIPGLGRAGNQPPPKVAGDFDIKNLMRNGIIYLTSVDIKDVRSLFRAEIPVLAAYKTGAAPVSAISMPNFSGLDKNLLGSGEPVVGIYHTHTAESFVPTSGATHKPGGQRGDIVEVGAALARRLEAHGIVTLHNTTVHDYPSFMKAYGASEVTVKKMVAEHPSLQMIFDIHRDAEKKANTTVMVNGVPAARIAIVVAVGQQDLPQPHWQQNHAFAKLLDAALNERYPGLSRGIIMEEWRYNQHLHPRALLLEVGCQENSLEEAERSMEMLGDILADILTRNDGSSTG